MREYSEKDGGPAFPVSVELIDRLGCSASMTDSGMTLRAYYAGQMMAALLTDLEAIIAMSKILNSTPRELAAARALDFTDALIAELAK